MSDPIVTRSEPVFSTITVLFRRDHYLDETTGEAWTDLAMVGTQNDTHDLLPEEQVYLVEQIIESEDGVQIVNSILDSLSGMENPL